MAKQKNDPQQQLINLQAQQLALQAAQAAAQQEFLRMRFTQLELPQFQHLSDQDKERLSFDKATEAFNESMKQIQLTGKLPNGQDTMEAALQKAQLTGLLGGEETLAAKQLRSQMSGFYEGQMTTTEQQRQFQNQLSQASVTGMYNGQQTTAEQQRQFQNLITQAQQTGTYNGQDTIDWAAKKAGITGYFDGQSTLARQEEEDKTGLGLMNLGAQLQGPANIFKFLRTFAGTPNGLQDMLSAVAGRYQLPGFTGQALKGDAYQPQTVASMVQQMQGAAAGGQTGYAPGTSAYPNPTGVMPPGGNPNLVSPGGTPSYAVSPPSSDMSLGGRAPGTVYQDPGYATRGSFTGPADTTQSVQNIVNGVPAMGTGNDGMPTTPSLTPYPSGETAPLNEYNYQPTGDGRYYVYPPSVEAPIDAHQYSSIAPLSYGDLDKATNITPVDPQNPYQPGGLETPTRFDTLDPNNPGMWQYQQPQTGQTDPYGDLLSKLVAPSKVNADAYNAMGTFQQDALKSAYGEMGITPDMFADQFKKSLPRYAGPAMGSFA